MNEAGFFELARAARR